MKTYRNNHICLKPNYRSTVSVAPNTLGDRLQTSNSTSRGAIKRPLTRSQPVLLEQRPNNSTLSTPMVDLTVDSSSESSVGSNGGLQAVHDSSPIGKRQRLQCYSPPVRFAPQSNSTSQLHTSTSATCSLPTASTANLEGSLTLCCFVFDRSPWSYPSWNYYLFTKHAVATGSGSSFSFSVIRAALLLPFAFFTCSTSG